MWSAEDEAAWDRAVTQARTEVQQWRAAHPGATLKQIEQMIDRRLAAPRARLVEAMAAAGAAAARPACPDCGAAMAWDGARERRLTTSYEQTLALTRRYARCPACGTGFFPPG